MVKIAVCDDEEFYRRKIEGMLSSYLKKKQILYLIDTYDSGAELYKKSEDGKEYDICFLDVNMDEMDGIETAKKIRLYSDKVFLVFVTAYINYSPEGYKVNATRYLLKDNDTLEMALSECMDTVLKKMYRAENRQSFEFVEGTCELALDHIIYIESNLHKLTFFVMGKEMIAYNMYAKLDTIADKIQMEEFLRIHKSYLVNLKYVEDLKRYKILLMNGEELNVAKSRYKEIEGRYISYKGDI